MFEQVWGAALAGVAAGLGVAMPLGAIAALLLREGVVNGFRVAAAAAAGVATVDLAYCTAAMLGGAAVAPAIEEHRGPALIASGLLIVAVGLHQLVGVVRPPAVVSADVSRARPLAAYVRFVGLTAVNPTTLVYFVALAGAVTGQSGSPAGPVVFVAAVGLSSLAWQLVLAATGSLFGRSFSPRTTRAIGVGASLLIVALGAAVLVGGVAALG